MDLFVIVPVDFVVKHSLCLSDVGHILPHTGSYHSILEPAIWPFHFTPGLGGEGISDLDLTVIHHLFPLGIGFIGEGVVFPPQGVSALDEPKDGVGVDGVEKRRAMLQHYRLQGADVGPRGLFLKQGSIEDEAAKVV